MAAITSNGTGGGNWSAGASWTGAAVPIEGDTVIIQNGDTITIDQNITVGADSATAAIDVANGGKLEVLHTVAANYTLICKGDLKTSVGGDIEFGTVANPIPSTRTFTVKLNYSAALAEGKYGFINNGGMILQGASKTPHTLLTSNLAGAGTVWTVGDTTNWAAGDKVAIASTSRTYSQHEQEVIQTVDSGTQITCVAGVTNAHSGTSPTQAEVINLTRNIVITSYNTSYRGYVYCDTGSTSDVDYIEFYMIGYHAATKYGISFNNPSTTNFSYCSVWGYASSNSGFRILTTATNVTIDNCIAYNVRNGNLFLNATGLTLTNNIFMGVPQADGIHIAGGNSITFDNNFTNSNYGEGLEIGNNTYFTSFDNVISHSNRVYGVRIGYTQGFSYSNLTIWRNNNYGLFLYQTSGTIDTVHIFANTTANIYYQESGPCTFDTFTTDSDSVYNTTIGLYMRGSRGVLKINNSTFGSNTIHSTCDVYFLTTTFSQLIFDNVTLDSTTEVDNTENTVLGSYLQSQDHNSVQYADKAWYRNGIVVRDSTTYKYGSYATRFDYQANNAEWLEYETYIPVKDGEQIVASAWLRKNASYTDANRPKITLSGQGITEDSDQMSDVTDTWERVTVTGTPTRTGLAKLTISTYLVNAGASAWVDFQKTDILSGVLNTIEGDYWANGHIAEVFMDTGSITAVEFWSTLTSDVNTTSSFGKLLKDYIDAAISGRAPANEYDTQMGYIPANLGDVPTATELNTAHGAGSWEGTTPANVADAVWDELEAGHTVAGSFGEEVTKQGKKLDRNLVWLLP